MRGRWLNASGSAGLSWHACGARARGTANSSAGTVSWRAPAQTTGLAEWSKPHFPNRFPQIRVATGECRARPRPASRFMRSQHLGPHLPDCRASSAKLPPTQSWPRPLAARLVSSEASTRTANLPATWTARVHMALHWRGDARRLPRTRGGPIRCPSAAHPLPIPIHCLDSAVASSSQRP